MLIPTHNNTGGMGAAVTLDKKGNGRVSAMYKVNSVIRINGDRGKTIVELFAVVAVTAELPGLIVGQAKVESTLGGIS
jgi:hypothetical protein